MNTRIGLPMVLAGSVLLAGCFDDDDPVKSSVRVIHASANAPAVNVVVNGSAVVSGADYKQAAVLTPDAGRADIAVDALLPGDQTLRVIDEKDVSLRSDTDYDVIAVGLVGDDAQPLEPLVLTDDGAREDADSVRLRVAHLSPAAQKAVNGPVEVYLSVPGANLDDEGVLSFSFEYKAVQGPIEVPAGDYQIRVAIPGDSPTVVFDSGSVPLAAGSDLLVGAVDNTTPETTPDGDTAVNNSPVSLIAVTGDGQVIELFDSSQQAGVKVVHNSSDAPPVAILVDDAVAIPSLSFPDVAPGPGINNYAVIPDGTRNLKVSPANSINPVNSAVIDADVVFGQASAKTVIAVNLLDAIEPLVLEDSVRSIATQASLRVVHGAVEAGTVDVYLVPTAEGGAGATVLNAEVNAPTLNDFEFKTNTGYLPVAAGDYVVFITDQDGNELLKTGSVPLAAGGVYTAIARLAPEDDNNTAGLTLLDDFVVAPN
ncbi:hypothetical protein BKP64_10015 [Marinobacter salinus]|uniref:DUF4397 domain-containing protein n=1 Tax=Marinobacter salinus TaxID=1874317 RepID=A0A1D9GLP1_9GAMM|nr:DUF4397 domain-containing protein [Marinobacter salinus]AOY88471.1 hypothetical protein BKP64_10015 [Marinobacter salinus]